MKRCFMGYTPEDDENEKFYVLAFPELTIYGHTIDHYTKRDYPEDWQHTVDGRKQGMEFGCWHSEACVDGEIGSNPVDGLRQITQDTFLWAWDEGWPEQPPALAGPIAAVYSMDDDGGLTKVWDSQKGEV